MPRYESSTFVPAPAAFLRLLGRPAVFLDRDGTLNEEVGHVLHTGAVRLLPDAVTGLRLLNQAGLTTVVITNQSGVGRGLFTEATLASVVETLLKLLGAGGAHLNALYYCPHHPDDGCACRKPLPGMLYDAAADLALALPHSYVIGDTLRDLESGWAAGCHTVLVRTGNGPETLRNLTGSAQQPDAVCATLAEAAEWVLAHRSVHGPVAGAGAG